MTHMCFVGSDVKYHSFSYWSIVMTSPVEFSTGENHTKQVWKVLYNGITNQEKRKRTFRKFTKVFVNDLDPRVIIWVRAQVIIRGILTSYALSKHLCYDCTTTTLNCLMRLGPDPQCVLKGLTFVLKLSLFTGMVCEPEFFSKINSRDSLTQ